MMGLLWKDIYYIKKMWKTVLFFSSFFVIFRLVNGDSFSAMIFIAILVGGNFSILPFTCDNYSKWNEYQYALPVSKKMVVCSRYLFGLILFGGCLLLSILGMILVEIELALFSSDSGYVTLDYISSELLPVFFVPLAQAISFPFLYRFGPEKGRLYVVCAVAVIAALTAIVAIQTEYQAFSLTYSVVLAMITVVVAVLYGLSLLLSIYIEEKKEI